MVRAARVAWVETHVGSPRAARAMADAVVGARLAACANWSAIDSAYWWEGRIVREGEVRVVFTTARPRLRALRERVEQLHPYEVPYIAWGDDLQVTAAYAAWATRATAAPRARPRRRPSRARRRTR